MKVHIVSLQRTGSKSLLNAVHNALKAPLHFKDITGTRTTLGEFFHLWEGHGYKFSTRSYAPYVDEVVFRTAPNFKSYKSANFLPVHGDVDSLEWDSFPYINQLRAKHIHYLRVLLSMYHDSNYVVKTQIATLAEDCVDPISHWLLAVLEDFDLTINLVPSDLVKWVCSNYVCDTTGVFVPCASQDNARAAIKAEKLVMPADYVHKMLERLRSHDRLIAGTPNVWTIKTEDLSDPLAMAALGARIGGVIEIEHPKEFSAEGYEVLFNNYDDIKEMVAAVSPSRYQVPMPPLTYPIA
jgi:hypothetical protein